MTRLDPFKIKSLDQLEPAEWDMLCDGCGICCLYKVSGASIRHPLLTRVVCRYLDVESCRCSIYQQRHDLMPTCLELTCENIHQLSWLPETCAYRRLAEGKPLPWWHYLRSGKRALVHQLGISVRDVAINEDDVDLNDLQKYTIQAW